MTYDDRDVLMQLAGSDRHCIFAIQALVQVPILDGEDGPACHPELIKALAQDLAVLGLCSLTKHSPLPVDSAALRSNTEIRSVERNGS